jgi:cytochrome c-type biogenesis protein CcmH
MGWVALALIGIVVFVTLRLIGVSRGFGWFTAAALLLGATGYALQQHATLAGHPVRAESQPIVIDPGMVAFRAMIFPGSPDDARILAAADDQLRSGATFEATQALLAAVHAAPRDAALWTGLGSALAAHDGGQLSPAAQFAFQRAWQLAPRSPGPAFFLGMAFVQSGDLTAAKIAWLRALALTPRDARYRIDIAERLALLDELAAMSRRARGR